MGNRKADTGVGKAPRGLSGIRKPCRERTGQCATRSAMDGASAASGRVPGITSGGGFVAGPVLGTVQTPGQGEMPCGRAIQRAGGFPGRPRGRWPPCSDQGTKDGRKPAWRARPSRSCRVVTHAETAPLAPVPVERGPEVTAAGEGRVVQVVLARSHVLQERPTMFRRRRPPRSKGLRRARRRGGSSMRRDRSDRCPWAAQGEGVVAGTHQRQAQGPGHPHFHLAEARCPALAGPTIGRPSSPEDPGPALLQAEPAGVEGQWGIRRKKFPGRRPAGWPSGEPGWRSSPCGRR